MADFSKISWSLLRDGLDEIYASRYEDSKVRRLLKKFGMQKAIKTICKTSVSLGGPELLTFRAFSETFESFPFLFASARLEKLHLLATCTLPVIFKDFRRTPIFTAYNYVKEANLYPQELADRPFALVFPRKGIPCGLVVYETNDLEACLFGLKETALVFRQDSKHSRYLVVRTFDGLLTSLVDNGAACE